MAPIFNLGLSAGGFLLALSGVLCAHRRSRLIGVSLVVSGFLLNLVGVFDEVYGRLHYYVSVAFFLSLAVLLAEYSIVVRCRLRRVLSLLALAVGALSWLLHMVYGIPRGAAVPELVSIFVSLPFYLDFLAGADEELPLQLRRHLLRPLGQLLDAPRRAGGARLPSCYGPPAA